MVGGPERTGRDEVVNVPPVVLGACEAYDCIINSLILYYITLIKLCLGYITLISGSILSKCVEIVVSSELGNKLAQLRILFDPWVKNIIRVKNSLD